MGSGVCLHRSRLLVPQWTLPHISVLPPKAIFPGPAKSNLKFRLKCQVYPRVQKTSDIPNTLNSWCRFFLCVSWNWQSLRDFFLIILLFCQTFLQSRMLIRAASNVFRTMGLCLLKYNKLGVNGVVPSPLFGHMSYFYGSIMVSEP